jgi:multiple sugar transport system ATP-binding protein
MVYVTHDQVEAMTLADRIVVLNEGAVEQVGTPLGLYHHPRNRFVAGFIGSPRMNFVHGTIAAVEGGALTVDVGGGVRVCADVAANGAAPGQKITLGLRPEHLVRGGAEDVRFEGEVIAVEHLGGETFIHVARHSGDPMLLKCEGGAPIRVGEQLSFGASAAACHVFDGQGAAFARRGRGG